MPSTMEPTSSVGCPPLSRTHFMTAAAAPLRISCPVSMSTPLIRVWAVNSTNVALSSPPADRQHVVLREAVHACDPDRRQKRPDGRRDQTDQQRHQHDQGLLRAGVAVSYTHLT